MFTVITMTTSTARMGTPAVTTAAASIAAIDMGRTLTQLPFWSSLTEQEQKKAARSGYDLDILPSDLSTYGGAAKNLLQDLQSRNERMFNMTFLMLHLAPTKQKLEIAVLQSASVAQTHNCILTRLDFQQEDGLMSSLPLEIGRAHV